MCNGAAAVHLQLQGRTLKDLALEDRGEPLISIGAYCLMPNHFHLLVHELKDGGISRFMQKLTTGYTMYFNKRYERTGALFQGKFRAAHANNDSYLKYLVSYIHLNPVKLIEPKWKENGIGDRVSAEEYLKGYVYSSYLDYAGVDRVEHCILDKNALPEYFLTHDDFNKNLMEWLDYGELSRSNLDNSLGGQDTSTRDRAS